MTSSQGDFAQALAGQAQQQTVSIANQISVASLKHVQNAGSQVDASIRSSLNLIAGTGVTLSFSDDSVNDRVSVTIGAGGQLDYAQITASVTGITVTTEGTATSVVSGNSISYDGSKVRVEFFTPKVTCNGQANVTFIFFRDSTALGQSTLDLANSSAFSFGYATCFDTPSAGAHTYSVKAFTSAATIDVGAGAGGAGALMPAFIRVAKA